MAAVLDALAAEEEGDELAVSAAEGEDMPAATEAVAFRALLPCRVQYLGRKRVVHRLAWHPMAAGPT